MNLIILAIALYGLITDYNLIKKVMCLKIVQSIIILTFLGSGSALRASPPLLLSGSPPFADPVPQALMLTAIVISVCFDALAVIFIVRIYKKHGTIHTAELHER